jgi:type I restriction enzyme R subunit
VHRVQTNLDEQGGVDMEDALIAGADLFVPEGADDVKDFYSVGEFERKITLPDWTGAVCTHLAALIRATGPMEKTLIFCVNMDHALDVRQQLQNRFADLGIADYAVRIVSEEHDAASQLADFADPTKRTPVIVTTVDLLSTGVDIPPVRNVVFIKPVGSVVMFKQIVGRGTRLDETTHKEWFRIIDYTNATRLFDDWDRPAGEQGELPPRPWSAVIKLEVLDAVTSDPVTGAWAIAVAAPNEQVQLKLEGDYLVARDLPETAIEVHVGAYDHRTRIVRLPAAPVSEAQVAVVELRASAERAELIILKGVQVEIASEVIITVDAAGRHMTVDEYLAYAKGKTIELIPHLGELRKAWLEDQPRSKLLHDLEEFGVLIDLGADLYKVHDADGYDVLGHLAFGRPLVRKDERVEAFHNHNSNWLAGQPPERQAVIFGLLDAYRSGGIGQLQRRVLQLDRFERFGGVRGVIQLFGGTAGFDELIIELKRRLYPNGKEVAAA